MESNLQTGLSSAFSTSPSLLARAVDGEAMAWQRIVQLYGPLVYNWARRKGLQSCDAADITQDTFAAVHTRLKHYDGDREGATFRGWLWTITRNKIADLARSRQQSPLGGTANLQMLNVFAQEQHPPVSSKDVPSSSESGEGLVVTEANDRHEVVLRALTIMRDRFEVTSWQAFWRTTIDGCSPDDVADELGMSRWAIYKARSRVLHRLRSELAGLENLTND